MLPQTFKLKNGSTLTVRDATINDLDSIFEIYDYEVYNSTVTFDAITKTPEQRIEWFHMFDHKYPILVAEEEEQPDQANNNSNNKQIVAWSRLYAYSPRKAYDRTAECAVYVHHKKRGLGLGLIMSKLLIDQCPILGVKVILAKITADNIESIKLHEKLGFKTFGVMKRCGEKFGKILDVTFMSLNLD